MQYLTVEQVAEMLQVKKETVKTMIKRGHIPATTWFQIGGKGSTRRFIKERLEEWLVSKCKGD